MLPNLIIINTHQAINDFRRFVKTTGEHLYIIDEIIQQILFCCALRNTANYQLEELAAEIQLGEWNQDECFLIPIEFAGPVFDLGIVILKELEIINAFNTCGELLYDYSEQHECKGLSDLVLERSHY